MEAPLRTLRRKQSKRSKCLTIAGVILFLVILAIVIPLAVILPRKKQSKGLKSTAIIPLYIYPEAGAWDPLYEAITSHAKLDFTVIVNPDSGPGLLPYPNNDYAPQIQRLNAYSNVRTVGYVRTGYGARNITSVLEDVANYAGWDANTTTRGLGMSGIFFDEVVSEYSTEAAEYMRTINEAVKDASGLLSNKLIIHNPGIIPDSRLNDPSTDVTVVFEEAYQVYGAKEVELQSLPQNRSQYSYMVHSLPQDMGKGSLRNYVADLSKHAKYLFLTDLNHNYYESFGLNWEEYTDTIPT
jgi:hypothetical protein